MQTDAGRFSGGVVAALLNPRLISGSPPGCLERGVHAASPATNNNGLNRPEGRAPYAHFAPVFGACLCKLKISRATATRMFIFNHLRSVLAAAVRLNIVGPMEAQLLQNQLSPKAENVRQRCENLTLAQIAQTAPLLDLWQGAQDRLYSRLFQS